MLKKRSPGMGTEFQIEGRPEHQHDIWKFCGDLFEGFGVTNQEEHISYQEAHYRDENTSLFREKETG